MDDKTMWDRHMDEMLADPGRAARPWAELVALTAGQLHVCAADVTRARSELAERGWAGTNIALSFCAIEIHNEHTPAVDGQAGPRRAH
jgi:hypothetical protein